MIWRNWRCRDIEKCVDWAWSEPHKTVCITDVVQSYWACFGLYPSSCMWKTKYHNVSETGSVSVLRWTQWLRLALSNGPNWVGLSCPILFSTYKMMDKVQNKSNTSIQHTPLSESFQVYNWCCVPNSRPLLRQTGKFSHAHCDACVWNSCLSLTVKFIKPVVLPW
jgi:hypothetical protein